MKEPRLNSLTQAINTIYPQPQGNYMNDQMPANEGPMITVDGNNYPVNALPGDIQEFVAAYQKWEVELSSAKLEVFKLEGAMRAVSSEIQTRVRNMVAAAVAAKEQGEAANETVATTPESEGGHPD